MNFKIDIQSLAKEFLAENSFETSSKQIEIIEFASSYVKFFAKWLDNLDNELILKESQKI